MDGLAKAVTRSMELGGQDEDRSRSMSHRDTPKKIRRQFAERLTSLLEDVVVYVEAAGSLQRAVEMGLPERLASKMRLVEALVPTRLGGRNPTPENDRMWTEMFDWVMGDEAAREEFLKMRAQAAMGPMSPLDRRLDALERRYA